MRPSHFVAACIPLALLAGCASMVNPETAANIPDDAVAATRIEPNGDEITEYRVGSLLRVVKVVPVRGPTYYLYDRNGDGRADKDKNTPVVYFKLFEW